MEFSDNEQLTNNCSDSFSNEQKTILLIARMSSGAVSAVLCLIAVILVCYLRLYKFFVYRLALYQVLSCLAFSVAEALQMMNINYVENNYHGSVCRFTAVLFTYTMWVKLLLALCLVFHIFSMAVFFKNLMKWEIPYLIISFVFPLAIVWIPFINDYYDFAGGWCWIRDWKIHCASEKDTAGIIEQFTLWYGPLYVFFLLCFIAVIIIIVYLVWRDYCINKSESQPLLIRENPKKTVLKELLPLLAYPIIFFTLAIFPLIDSVYGAIFPYDSFYLMMNYAITQALLGVFYALALFVHVTCLLYKRKLHHDHETSARALSKLTHNNQMQEDTYGHAKGTIASTNAVSSYNMPNEESEDESDT